MRWTLIANLWLLGCGVFFFVSQTVSTLRHSLSFFIVGSTLRNIFSLSVIVSPDASHHQDYLPQTLFAVFVCQFLPVTNFLRRERCGSEATRLGPWDSGAVFVQSCFAVWNLTLLCQMFDIFLLNHQIHWQAGNMAVSLRLSRARQSAITNFHDAAIKSEDDRIDHDLDSETSFSNQSSISDDSMSSKLSASNSQYPIELRKAGIYRAGPNTKLPVNFPSLVEHLGRDRADLTLDPAEIALYSKALQKVGNEAETLLVFLPQMIRFERIFLSDQYSIICNRPWTFQQVFSEQLGHPQPDLTYGLTSEELQQTYPDALSSEREFWRSLQPIKNTVLPLLFLEAKGPKSFLEEARLQNQNNGACALRNIVALKRAAKQPPKSYVGTILALSLEVTAESVQSSCHWMTLGRDGKDQFWSSPLQSPMSIHDLPEAQKLVRNAFEFAEFLLQRMVADLALLEKQYTRSRKRGRSPSTEIEPMVKLPGKKRRNAWGGERVRDKELDTSQLWAC